MPSAAQLRAWVRYKTSPKGRATQSRYARTPKGRAQYKKRFLQGAAVVLAWKEAHAFKCMDCAQFFHPFQLQADHRPGTVKRGKRICNQWAVSTIQAELAKCDCVCANCHMLRTFTRDWRRRKYAYGVAS